MKTSNVDSAIEAAAAAKFGTSRVNVMRRVEPDRNSGFDIAGVWFWLAVDRGSGWELLGRRRTKGELLQLIENRTYQPSTRPAGAR